MTQREPNGRQKQSMHWFKETTTTVGQNEQAAKQEELRTLTRRTLTTRQTETTSTNNGTFERSTSQFQTNIKKVSGIPDSHLICSPPGIKTHIARISYECGPSTQRTKTDKSAKDIPPPKQSVSALVYSCQQSERVSKLQEKFIDKKEKRGRELKEMQKNLYDVNHKNIKAVETITAEIEAKEENNMNETKTVTYRRSQTDLEEAKIKSAEAYSSVHQSRKDIPHEQTDKVRSKLAQQSTTRERTKKTPRNPEGTHRLAAGQKPKYKLHSQLKQEKTDKDKSAKEEIKKRLEELRKNTKKLVNKNLEKKKLKAEHTNESAEKKEKQCGETEQKAERENEFLNSHEAPQSLDCNTIQQNKIAKGHITDRPRLLKRSQLISRSALSLHTNIIWASPKVKSNPLNEEGKRIGLLRKPDNSGENSSNELRGLGFEKENIALEAITPKLSTFTEKTEREFDNEKKKKAIEIETLDKEESKEPRLKKTIEEKLLKPLDGLLGLEKNNEQNEGELRQVSKAKIEENIGFIGESKKQTKLHDLPYWLKPSTAQVYPYNFILAVRRKLEAITQTPNNQKQQKRKGFRTLENEYISPEEDFECDAAATRSSLTKPQMFEETITSKSRSNTENFEFKFPGEQKNQNNGNAEISERVEKFLIKIKRPLKCTNDSNPKIVKLTSAEKLKRQKIKVSKSSNKFQEPLMKPTKCTLDLSPEITKLTFPQEVKVESPEFDTNLKNSFQVPFTENLNSNSSETITNLSSISMQLPLTNTVSEVSSLETESKTTFTKEQENAKESGPKLASVSPLSVERIGLLKIQRTENKNMDKEFSQLLEDFNRSLTQVIQVNEQLKFTLDKSQQLLSPRNNKQYTIEYSSDFEPATESSEDSAKSEKCQVKKLEQTLKYHKGCLFVTSPKKMSFPQKSQSCFTSPTNANKPLEEEEQKFVPAVDVGAALKNLSNSSAILTLKDDEGVLENSNSMEFGKRLEFMERMKTDLTLTIKESQERRRRVTHGSESVPKSNNSYSNKSKRLSQDSGNDSISKTPKKSSENFDADSKLFFAKGTKDLRISSDNNTQFSDNQNSERKKSPESSAETMTARTTTTSGDNSEKLIEIFKKGRLTKWSGSSRDGENTGRSKPSCKSHTIDAGNETSKTSLNGNSNHSQLAANNNNVQNENGEIFYDSGSNKENITQHCLQSEILGSTELKPCRHGSSKNPRAPEELPKASPKESWRENSKSKTFITHVNYSRGDFMNSNASQRSYSDHQFHPPSFVASHRTSAEFDQSADDEITSSAMSSNRNLTNYTVSSTSKNKVYRRLATGAEIVKFFYLSGQGKYDKSAVSQDSMSESSLNYSNVGLYDKLIQSETTKTEHLTALLKMRERALLDRTKSQIAWLEVQKARYKAKGLVNHIAAIKKKQRGILLKMDKERQEIKRLLLTTSTSSTTIVSSGPIISISNNYPTPHRHRKEIIITPSTLSSTPKLLRKHNSHSALVQKENIPQSSHILKGTYELESSKTLENLLRKREEDLRKRRQHVERLLQWHQRLDEEEAEVLHLEEQLLNCNNNNANGLQTGSKVESTEKLTGVGYEYSDPGPKKSLQTRRSSRERKMERRLIEIDKSLRDLTHISSIGSSTGTNSLAMGQNSDENTASAATIEMEYVRTTGNKLNKLWRRLTSQQFEKYDPTRRYKLCKADLEQLYEEAKLVVLREFAHDEERITAELLEKSASHRSSSSSPAGNLQEAQVSSGDKEPLIVPRLNLNFSSGQSEQDEESNTTTNTAAGANTQECIYSPSLAEENFKAHQQVLLSTSDTESASTKSQRLERNVQLFLALTKRIVEAHGNGSPELQRSLSDTQLADLTDVAISKKSTTSHKNAASASQTRQSSPVSISANKNSRAIHRHSKSSTIELSNIPNINSFTGTEVLENFSSVQQTKVEEIMTRSTIICSAVKVTPSAVSSQFESPHREAQIYNSIPKKSHLSRQLGSSQAEEISVQSNQLTSQSFSAEILSASSDNVSEPNISTDQSTTLNFESISIEKFLSPINNSGTCWSEDIKKKNNPIINNTTHNNASFESKKFGRNYSNEEHISNHSSIKNCTINVNGSDWIYDVDDETRMENISLPVFEDTVQIAQVEEEELDKQSETLMSASSQDKDDASSTSTTLTPGNYSPEECKELQTNQSLEREKAEILPSSPSLPSQISIVNQIATNNTHQYTAATATQLMPDIINELELRRHQLIIEHEHLRQYEHVAAVPYMYVREIPNKPPPPYVPPAHGSPMTAIFPSEDRIKEITYRRTHELYCELSKTDYNNEKGEHLPSVMDEQITNIYERITLDICREFLEQHSEILRDGDPINFHHQLAFFNPPNRLRCIQNAIYKEVRACLAMDKTQLKRTQVYSVYGQRAKQDHIGKIIIQEMYDEDDRWCNFYREEKEVLDLIVEEMIIKKTKLEAKNILMEEGRVFEKEVEENKHEVIEIDGVNYSKSQLQSCHINREQPSPTESSSIIVETAKGVDEVKEPSFTNDNGELINHANLKDIKSLDSELDATQLCT